MELYKKPSIVGETTISGILPLAALSAAKLAVVGVAFGLGMGGLASKIGGKVINSSHTKILASRKNFALE